MADLPIDVADGYDHSILAETHIMIIQFGVGLLLFMTYYAVFLVIDRNHPVQFIVFIILNMHILYYQSHAYNLFMIFLCCFFVYYIMIQSIHKFPTSTNQSTSTISLKTSSNNNSHKTQKSSPSFSNNYASKYKVRPDDIDDDEDETDSESSDSDSNPSMSDDKDDAINIINSNNNHHTKLSNGDNIKKPNNRRTAQKVVNTNKVTTRTFTFSRKRKSKAQQNNDNINTNTNDNDNNKFEPVLLFYNILYAFILYIKTKIYSLHSTD